MLIKNLGSLIELLIEASISAFLNVSLVWFANELLKLREVALTALGISKDEL